MGHFRLPRRSTIMLMWLLFLQTWAFLLPSCEYTDMQPFVMYYFQGCRASLESLCINFGGELSTITTLMFAVLLNDLVRSLIFHWVYTILFIQRFQIFQQIWMINTLVHNFPFNFQDFEHLTNSNFSTNSDYLYI